MSTKKLYKCPFCNRKYLEKQALYDHMENEHKIDLDGLSAAQVYFNFRNIKRYDLNTKFGKSVILHKPVKFNETTEKYERYADDNERMLARKLYVNNMVKKYGKETLLDDPEYQKMMLSHRKISNKYKWDDGTETDYVGSYERAFLDFLNVRYDWKSSSDIMGPAPMIFHYIKANGKEAFHIPDFYIQSINLIVNIKSNTNNGYRLRDIDDENLQDEEIKKSTYNYIKIYDNDFKDFVKTFDYLKSLEPGDKAERIFIK